MKYFHFWVKAPFDIKVGSSVETINVLAGSNESKEHALQEAERHSKDIEQRIARGDVKSNYEATIKEHVVDVVDENNIITVCRYGASVLNTTQYTILDLDQYPFDFFDLFSGVRKLPKKERIVTKFLQKLEKYPELGKDFRIYETSNGIRVIGKKYLYQKNRNSRRLMKKLSVDILYMILSEKQGCYRARLTPKPYRIKSPTIKVTSPLVCETEEYAHWLEQYEVISKNFRVVKLLQVVGQDFSYEPIIKLHDSTCQSNLDLPLA